MLYLHCWRNLIQCKHILKCIPHLFSREHYLEKIAIYLSRCGLQSNSDLVEKGYPDLGWDPVEGERYLDFLRFCVWVNGKLNLQIKWKNFLILNKLFLIVIL